MDLETIILGGVVGGIVGFITVWFASMRYRSSVGKVADDLIGIAKKEAAVDRKQQMCEADLEIKKREYAFEQQTASEKSQLKTLQGEVNSLASDLGLKEQGLVKKSEVLDKLESKLAKQEKELGKERELYKSRLDNLSNSPAESVFEQLKEETRKECEEDISNFRKELLTKSEQEIQREAKGIIIATMQRIAGSTDDSVSASVVSLPNDEMKGRIIGKEGRNIKAFEALTGVTLMIDEVPSSVLISCFDPVRREAAKVALEYLVKDGRIHPTSIEEAVKRGQDEIENLVFQYGENAVQKLKLSGIPNEVLSLLGKLKYRYSFNQNTLDHSIETAFLCSMMASELGLDPMLAKRAGLLHDIGKAVEHDYEGSHASEGGRILRIYGENESVSNAVEAHHKEIECTSLYAPLLMVADSISATRPGARAESMDAFAKRLERLESIGRDIEGVSEVYAIQAGREIRVMVEPTKVAEKDARRIALKIRNRIEEELQYPSSITVTVIREERFTEVAT